MYRVGGVGDEPLAEAVLALGDKVHNSSHRGLCQQGFFIQMNNPVLRTQHIHVVLWMCQQQQSLNMKEFVLKNEDFLPFCAKQCNNKQTTMPHLFLVEQNEEGTFLEGRINFPHNKHPVANNIP